MRFLWIINAFLTNVTVLLSIMLFIIKEKDPNKDPWDIFKDFLSKVAVICCIAAIKFIYHSIILAYVVPIGLTILISQVVIFVLWFIVIMRKKDERTNVKIKE